MRVCETCKHLIDHEPHVCPCAEYIEAHDRLVLAAAQADEIFSEKELAQAAWDSEQAAQDGRLGVVEANKEQRHATENEADHDGSEA